MTANDLETRGLRISQSDKDGLFAVTITVRGFRQVKDCDKFVNFLENRIEEYVPDATQRRLEESQ